MNRTVSSRLVARTQPGTRLVYAVAAVRDPGYDSFAEDLAVTIDGVPASVTEVADHHGGRFHVLDTPEAAEVVFEYRAEVGGQADSPVADPADLIRYVRPSRYCESDKLLPTSYAEFGALQGVELLHAVREWVAAELAYVPGSSRPIDGAVDTLLARRGVCRDYAHLVASLLRGKNVPARLAACYAPGLDPMDFHAVVEAYVDGAWHVVDATGLAPRQGLLRISTGADASDTAFLSTVAGSLRLTELKVDAAWDAAAGDSADPGAGIPVILR
ncbi:putative transglutaminase-like protein [Zafaria cholistanensis]|uniref:Putative transglutaminase-like protein n=1 Tax=Zafaria cholistanensis TaxID=1682741 RepID=A0A5A7NQ13_9MICC|nr:transglutaminase family protein [Zafaria cholistanensis]GER21861.1 putative transglutaminase-like protein [Zafaria cholistanensis]